MLRSKENPNVFHRFTPEGMEVYLEKISHVPLISAQVLVKTGSLDESPDEGGLAHVLEHMLFKGTKNFPEPGQTAHLIESAGGDLNAYTTYDHTLYYFTAPSKFLEKGLPILMDMCFNALIDENELSKELEVILEEIKQSNDNPGRILHKNLFAAMYQGNPFGLPIIGSVELVQGYTKQKVSQFYEKWYVPNNMLLVITGDFEIDNLWESILKLSSSSSPKSIPDRFRPPWPMPHDPQTPFPRGKVALGDYQEIRFKLAFEAPCLETTECVVWETLSSILGQGDSSRLTSKVKDDLQLVTNIESSVYSIKYPQSTFSISLFGVQSHFLMALKNIRHEIELLASEGPTAAEIRRVITATKAERWYAQESIEGVGRNAVFLLTTQAKLDFEEQYFKQLEKITADQIKEAAIQLLNKMNLGQFSYSLLGKNLDEKDQSTQLELQIISTVKGTTDENPNLTDDSKLNQFLNSLSFSEYAKDVSQTQFSLGESRRLHLNQRSVGRLPLVSALVVSQGGLLSETKETNGISGLLAQMLTRGSRSYPYKSLIGELEDRAASISAFSSRDTFGIRMDCLSEHSSKIWEMTQECLFYPTFPKEEWDKVLRETKETIIAQKDSPNARLAKLAGPLLYGDHIYALPSYGTVESLESLTYDQLDLQYQKWLQSQKFVLAWAGASAPSQAGESLFQHWLRRNPSASLPSLKENTSPNLPSLQSNRVSFDLFEREQVHILYGLRAYSVCDPRRTALEIAVNILAGQGGRLFRDLRDEQSLAYSVGAQQSPSLLSGVFSTYIATSPNKVEKALEGLKKHIQKLAKEPPTAYELERAQLSVINGVVMDAQHLHYQASQLAMSDIYGLNYDHFLTFQQRIESVTSEQVSSSLMDLLQSNWPILAMVGPSDTPKISQNSELMDWRV
jgi:zinc protease